MSPEIKNKTHKVKLSGALVYYARLFGIIGLESSFVKPKKKKNK